MLTVALIENLNPEMNGYCRYCILLLPENPSDIAEAHYYRFLMDAAYMLRLLGRKCEAIQDLAIQTPIDVRIEEFVVPDDIVLRTTKI